MPKPEYLIAIGIGCVVGIVYYMFFGQQPPHASVPCKLSDPDFVDDSARCTICLRKIKSDLTYLDCGHAFHRECVRQWLRVRDTCPNCKKLQRTAM